MTCNIRLPLIGLGVVVLVGFGVSRVIRVGGLRPKLESELSAALGRQVKVGALSFSLFAGKIGADNISIADDPAFSNDAFITAKSLSAAVDLTPLLLSRTLYITGITLEAPQIRLIRGPGGTWNFSSMGKDTSDDRVSTSSPASLAVDKLAIEKRRLVVGMPSSTD